MQEIVSLKHSVQTQISLVRSSFWYRIQQSLTSLCPGQFRVYKLKHGTFPRSITFVHKLLCYLSLNSQCPQGATRLQFSFRLASHFNKSTCWLPQLIICFGPLHCSSLRAYLATCRGLCHLYCKVKIGLVTSIWEQTPTDTSSFISILAKVTNPQPLSSVLFCSGSKTFQRRAGELGAFRTEGTELPYDFISVLSGEGDWVQ